MAFYTHSMYPTSGAYLPYGGMGPQGPQGTRLASQVTCQIAYEMQPKLFLSDRKHSQTEHIGTDLGDAQFNIAEHDAVFVPRMRNLDVGTPLNQSAFAVFDGLPYWKAKNDQDKDVVDVYRYHKHFKFAGFALANYLVSNGDLANKTLDVQTKGIASYVNNTDRTIQPGVHLSWIPDIASEKFGAKSFVPTKRHKGNRPASIRALIVPLADVAQYIARTDERATKLEPGFKELFQPIIANASAFASTDGKTYTTSAEINVRKAALLAMTQIVFEREISLHDLSIGMNCTAVEPNAIGQIALY